MASFVSANTNSSSSTSSFTVNLPTGLQNGDLLIAVVNFNDDLETITPPAGWTAVDSAPVESGSQEGGVWYRYFAGGVTNPTWDITAAQKATGAIVAYRGVHQTTPFAVVSTRGTQSSSFDLVAPGVNTTASNQELLALYTYKASSVTNQSTPTGMTSRANIFTSGGGATAVGVFSQTIASASATGDRTSTYDVSSSSGYALLVALQDAAPVAGPQLWGIPLILNALIRFPGDPGMGNFYFGGREDQLTWPASETAIANWESAMGPWSGNAKLSIIRVFSAGSIANGFDHVGLCNTHYSNGRLPHVSFKIPSGLTQQEANDQTGQFFTWMDNLAAAFTSFAPNPIWWTFWHEPENDTNWQGLANEAQYRQICRNIKLALDARGVTNSVFWTTGFMCPYTFGSGGGTRDWRAWYPDWKGTTEAGSDEDNPNPVDFYLKGDPNAVVQGIGLDIYSWWDEGEPLSNFDDFDYLHSWAHDRMAFLGHSYNIMEHGVQAYHTGTEGVDAVYDRPTTLNYLSGMYDIMIQRDIVAMQVYNYALSQHAWRLEIEDPQQIRYEGYGTGLTRPNYKMPDII